MVGFFHMIQGILLILGIIGLTVAFPWLFWLWLLLAGIAWSLPKDY